MTYAGAVIHNCNKNRQKCLKRMDSCYPWLKLNVMHCTAVCTLQLYIPVYVYNDFAANRLKSCRILKINVRKSCLGIRSLRRRSYSFIDPRRQRRPTIGVGRRTIDVGRPVPSDHRCRRPLYRRGPPGRSSPAPLSACSGHRGTSRASHSSSTDTWGRMQHWMNEWKNECFY